VLSQAEIDSFAADGYVAVRGAVPADVLRLCQALYLFSDVDAASAPTRVRPGSHRDTARVLAPAGDEGMPFGQAARLAARASAARPTELATGQAGDVIVCHPFLVHAASWPHTGRHPRIMAQPGVALHDAFPLVPPLSPVEPAVWPERAA
jgi:Phytanoyl-CoA dioxygenase (PhyH)